MAYPDPLTYVEIDLKAIAHNLRMLRRIAQKNRFYLPTRPKSAKPIAMDLLAVIKADAYGHGVQRVAPLLEEAGVRFFGVSDVTEGVRLRELGLKREVLLFETTLPDHAPYIVDHRLTPTICTLPMAEALDRYARQKKVVVDAHVKVDTGMGRLGVWHEEAFGFIRKVHQYKHVRLTGLLTHFPSADTDKRFTKAQIQALYDLVTNLDRIGLVIPYIHAANSMGLTGYPTHVMNLARPGIMLYGLYPHPSLESQIALKPAMQVKSKVILVKDVAKGRSISYGRTFLTRRDMRIAVVPIGYNDGFFRVLSNKAEVLIGGQRCRVTGVVTMDQIMVDVTSVPEAKIGAPVVIMGRQKDGVVSADEVARKARTIHYEVVCHFGNRLPRVYKSRNSFVKT